MSYWIYLGIPPIARIAGTEAAYEVYHKACELAELTGGNCILVTEEGGEIIAEYRKEE